MRHQRFTCVRLSDSYLTVLIPPFDHIVHDLAITSSAACGSLKSAPVGRLRWTYHHLRYSIALTRFPGTLQEAHLLKLCGELFSISRSSARRRIFFSVEPEIPKMNVELRRTAARFQAMHNLCLDGSIRGRFRCEHMILTEQQGLQRGYNSDRQGYSVEVASQISTEESCFDSERLF